MIGQKLLVDAVIKIVKKTFKFDKVLDYVENPNDADKRIDELEMNVFHQGKLIEKLSKEVLLNMQSLCEICKKQIKEKE